MDRRNLLATAAASGAAGAALLATGGRALAQPALPPAVVTDPAYAQATLRVGTLSKQMSLLALERSRHPKVQEFAHFEADEQTAIAQVLTDQPNPPPLPLDPQHAALLQQLQAMGGPAFDRAYLANQIQGHQELLAIQQQYLNGPIRSSGTQHIAILARTVITMHLTMLQDLQGRMG